MGGVVRKRGRPVCSDSKHCRKDIRMTDKQLEMLEYIRKTTGKNNTEIFMDGLEMQYSLCKIQNLDE